MIRGMMENHLKIPQNLPKPLINFALGDPLKVNGFEPPKIIAEKLVQIVMEQKNNGYTSAAGSQEARQSVVDHFSTPDHPFKWEDVIMTFGAAGGLYNSISALCEKGDNLLVPRPGYPLCFPISQNLGVELRHYDLLPEKNWEIDLVHLKSLVNEKTRAILVNNPSNPCGTCFTKQHCLDIISMANELQLPIISDEVYYGITYEEGVEFTSLGVLTKEVPIICLNSISKMYYLPGYRCGWMIFYNHQGYFDKVINNLCNHAAIQFHPDSTVQKVLPVIFKETDDSHFATMKLKLKQSADYAFTQVSKIKGLNPIKPSAAMYMMINIRIEQFNGIEDDVDFAKKLLHEQGALVMPAHCFFYNNGFRLVLCQSLSNIKEFCLRLEEFCQNHYKRE
ncbi:tyrosine aminotransferase [Stylonychia lemnae]|uniref:Tyrosine aminotransferase n=1 Tax=Stylonychia lemnae TaxID=5949 RepID=A0A078AKR7_STYLE|nr:tyrosine aminotransferase [Stylonychia lemnae]|eukprot:CDW81383.1 tyrosine aminotransferase [Stylonychia lemnae]